MVLHRKTLYIHNSDFTQHAEQDFPIYTEMLLTKLLNKTP
jgi:hypothetical protein